MPWILRALAVTLGPRLVRNYLNKRQTAGGTPAGPGAPVSTGSAKPLLRVPSRRLR